MLLRNIEKCALEPSRHIHTFTYIQKVTTPYTQNYNFLDYNRKQHNEQTQGREHQNDDGLKLCYHHASRGEKGLENVPENVKSVPNVVCASHITVGTLV